MRRISRRRFLAGTLAGTGAAAASRLGWLDLLPGAGALAATRGTNQPPLVLPSPVFGTELQYFRMDAGHVAARLDLCRRAAFTVIQAYVPWNVHEWIPGRPDFEGRTRPVLPHDHADEFIDETPDQEVRDGGVPTGAVANTDLTGFLQQCKQRDFAVILRPGPFISDEWRNGGLPDWFLAEGYPFMYQYGPEGAPLTPQIPWGAPAGIAIGGGPLFYFPAPSYASPEYLAGTRHWLRLFSRFVEPWLVTNGGPVVALQVDDETCFFYKFGPFDVDYHPDSVAAYRRATGTDPPRAWPEPAEGPESLRAGVQWQRFKAGQVANYLGGLAAQLRATAPVPITHELELDMCPPTSMAAVAGVVDLHGEYYNGATPWELPTNELIAQAVRGARRQRGVTFAVEMTNANIALFQLLAGEGVVGGLQFTYTQGVPDGAVDDLGRLGRTFRTAGPLLASAQRRADVAVIWDNTLPWLPFGTDRWGLPLDARAAIERHLPALAALLIRAGYAFDFLDVEVAQQEDYRRYGAVFLASAGVLPRSAQQAAVDYVAAGGNLICWPLAPVRDEDLRPCTILRDALFPDEVHGFDPADQTVQLLGRAVPLWRGVHTFRPRPDASIVGFGPGGRPCALTRRFGRGDATLVGGWLAADSIPQRQGFVVASQDVSALSGAQASAAARVLATRHLGSVAADAMPDGFAAGKPQQLIVYTYPDQRRGPPVIAAGAVAYWDGDQVVPLVGVNTAEDTPLIEQLPFHPILPAHTTAVRVLARVAPQVETSDWRVQARVLDGPQPGTATISALNRWAGDVDATLQTVVGGDTIAVRVRLPSGQGMLLPVGYPVGQGVIVDWAGVQLTGAGTAAGLADLEVWSPAGGAMAVSLPAAPAGVRVDGHAASFSRPGPHRVTTELPPGDHRLTLRWEA